MTRAKFLSAAKSKVGILIFSLFLPKTTMLSLRFASVARKSTGSFSLRALSTAPAPTLHPSESNLSPPHLLTLADLTVPQIQSLISSAVAFKKHYKSRAIPEAGRIEGAKFEKGDGQGAKDVGEKTLADKTVALMFSKRSTRTRVASETAVQLLGQTAFPPFFDVERGG